MDSLKNVTKVFDSADEIPIDDSSRLVLMSDCHRGNGRWYDSFAKNQNIYFVALNHYYKEDYTYIEIGDGDELWESDNLSNIIHAYKNIFWLLSKFYNEGRLYMIFGNHDMVKKDHQFVKNNLYEYFDERQKKKIPLFKNIRVHEGLVLRYKDDRVFLIHGHQVDYLNNKLWKLSRFLVRYLWRPLEFFGVKDPTSTAKNSVRQDAVGKKLTEWVKREKHMLIAGHTHRPMFPEVGAPPYFNDGSTVHPRCITAIEIAEGCISLVKWCVKTRNDDTMITDREVLVGPKKLTDYFVR